MSIKDRAKTDANASLRLFNLQCMALAAHKARDTEALLGFMVEGLPLAYYLPKIG